MPASKKIFGYTQTQIAKMSGLHQSHISNYLSGKNVPSLKTMIKISDACNIDISVVTRYFAEKYFEIKGI